MISTSHRDSTYGAFLYNGAERILITFIHQEQLSDITCFTQESLWPTTKKNRTQKKGYSSCELYFLLGLTKEWLFLLNENISIHNLFYIGAADNDDDLYLNHLPWNILSPFAPSHM